MSYDWASQRITDAVNAFNGAIRDNVIDDIRKQMVSYGYDKEAESFCDETGDGVDPQKALIELNAAIREAIEQAKLEAYKTPRFIDRAADALADATTELVRRKIVDSRSPLGDALLDYTQEKAERSK